MIGMNGTIGIFGLMGGKRLSSRTLYSCGTIQFSYKLRT
jgi:hypothetical protein